MSEQFDEREFEIQVDPEDEVVEEEKPAGPPSKLLTYMRLCRIPNVFTAFSDVAMGYLLVHRGVDRWEPFVMLLAASGCLYTAGMVLNDVFDVDKDTKERPHRPIPSGAVSLAQARSLGFGLLVAGVLFAIVAGLFGDAPLPYRSGVVGLLLATGIVLYDSVLKETALAPWFMGACRFFNVLMGMSLASDLSGTVTNLWFTPYQIAAAGGIGIYIAGVTWFARTEATGGSRALLGFGTTVMIAGLAMLAFLPELFPAGSKFFLRPTIWPLVIVILMLAPLRRCIIAVAQPEPERVQVAVKQCILSLILLDAALVMLTNPLGFALAVCALLIPTLLLGRWVYST